jgi:hypothetical protein
MHLGEAPFPGFCCEPIIVHHRVMHDTGVSSTSPVKPRSHDAGRNGVASGAREWVLLAFRLPREPSTPRIAVWRKLKRLGVVQVVDGLVALPLAGGNRAELEALAVEVQESGGEATIWIGQIPSRADEGRIAERMREAVASDYRLLVDRVEAAQAEPPGRRRRTVARLRRELRRIGIRDHFRSAERESAERAVERLAATVEQLAS